MDRGVEFVIERLYRGSVINHRSFITEDKIDVSARCFMPVTLFFIEFKKMKEIMLNCPVLQLNVDKIETWLPLRLNDLDGSLVYTPMPHLSGGYLPVTISILIRK